MCIACTRFLKKRLVHKVACCGAWGSGNQALMVTSLGDQRHHDFCLVFLENSSLSCVFKVVFFLLPAARLTHDLDLDENQRKWVTYAHEISSVGRCFGPIGSELLLHVLTLYTVGPFILSVRVNTITQNRKQPLTTKQSKMVEPENIYVN